MVILALRALNNERNALDGLLGTYLFLILILPLTTNYFLRSPNGPASLLHLWETLLQEVEADSQTQGEIASVFARQISRPLLDRSFHRKVQFRQIFGHRESFEIIINKAEEKLSKVTQFYIEPHPILRTETRCSDFIIFELFFLCRFYPN